MAEGGVQSVPKSTVCHSCPNHNKSCRGVLIWTLEGCLSAQAIARGNWVREIEHENGELSRVTVFKRGSAKRE